jgi:hypothetical protein
VQGSVCVHQSVGAQPPDACGGQRCADDTTREGRGRIERCAWGLRAAIAAVPDNQTRLTQELAPCSRPIGCRRPVRGVTRV